MVINRIASKVLNTKDCTKLCFWYPKLLLKSIFMWPKDNTNRLYRNVMFGSIMACCIIVQYGTIGFITENFKDYNNSFSAVTKLSTLIHVIAKISILYYYVSSFKSILDDIFQYFWPSNLLGKRIEDSLRYSYHVLLVYLVAMHISGVLYATGVVCSPLFKNNRELPYKSIYPFDFKASPYYEIIYIVQSITVTHIVLECICGIDFLFMAICVNVTAQYRLLQQVMLKFGTKEMLDFNRKMELLYDLPNNNNTEKYSTEESKFLVRCIKHHQLLSRIVQKTEQVYQLIAFFQLGFSVIALCISSVLFTREDINMGQLVNISFYMTGHLLQLFYYCSFSNEMDYQMSILPDYLFGSFWYKINFVKSKQNIIFILKRSQITTKLRALNVFPLNYSTFIQVLKLTFSFYTVISSLANN